MSETNSPFFNRFTYSGAIFYAVVTVWMTAISILSFLKLDLEQWKLVIGVMANINTLFFYGAPLTTIVTVLKMRDSRYVIFCIDLVDFCRIFVS